MPTLPVIGDEEIAITTGRLEDEADIAAYWEERIQRLTQMSQYVDDGLYDDVLNPHGRSKLIGSSV